MSDYVVSARIDGDARGLKSAAAEGKAAVEDLKSSTRGVGDQATATEKPLDRLARALREVRMGAIAQNVEMKNAAKAQKEAEVSATSLGGTLRGAAGEMARTSAAAAGLTTNIGGTVGEAGKMGVVIGSVAGLLGGALGTAVSLAVSGLVSLAGSFLSGGKAADDASRATDAYRMSSEDLRKAVLETEKAIEKQTDTSEKAAQKALDDAGAQLILARAYGERAKQALNAAHADLEAAQMREKDPTLAGEGGYNPGSAEAGFRAGQIKDLIDRVAEIDLTIETAEQNLRAATMSFSKENVAGQIDSVTAATNRYRDALKKLDTERRLGLNGMKDQVKYDAELLRLSKEKEKAIKAARDAQKKPGAVDQDAIAFLNPVAGATWGSPFGQRGGRPHRGVDIPAAVGTKVGAAAAGTIIEVGNDPGGYGNFVIIDHGRGTTTRYAHLLSISKRSGRVEAGETFALSGGARGAPGSGNSRGAHVHYEVLRNGKQVNPAKGPFPADEIAAAEKAADQLERQAREAKRALEELQRSLGAIVGAFDPARAAAEKYADQLDRIAELNAKGLLSDSDAIAMGVEASRQHLEALRKADKEMLIGIAGDVDSGWKEMMAGIEAEADARVIPKMEEAGRRAAEAFEARGLEAAEAISRLIGGKIGGGFGDLFGMLAGLKTGNFNSVGGPIGNILTLVGGGRRQPGEKADPFAEGLQLFVSPLKKGLKDIVAKIGDTFKIGGDFEKTLGHMAGGAVLGSVVGPGVTSMFGMRGSDLGGSIGGALGSAAGEALKSTITSALGKAAGSFAGPIGSILGSVMGSAIGGMLKGSKRGSATITSVGGEISTSGNSSQFKGAATGMARNLQDALGQISEALGGSVGGFAVSVGMRDGKLRVDPTGKGNTKTKKGAVDFGQDEQGAFSFALANAIADGAIVGLSAAVQKALQSSSDINKAIREAVKVDELESLLEGVGGAMGRQLRDFERQAGERVRIARQYGFDVLKVEKMNAEERVKLTEQILGSRIGPLRDLLADLDFGDLFEGSIADQIAKLKGEAAKAKADAEAGVDGAAGRFADLERSIIEKTMEGFGTAGPELATARADAKSAAERIIQLENERMKAAQDATKETNSQLDEANHQLAEQTGVLRRIEQGIVGLYGGGGEGAFGRGATGFRGDIAFQ